MKNNNKSKISIGNTTLNLEEITYDELIVLRELITKEFSKMLMPIINFGNVHNKEIEEDSDISLQYTGIVKTIQELTNKLQDIGKLHVLDNVEVDYTNHIAKEQMKTGVAKSEDEAMSIISIAIKYTELLEEIATILGSGLLTLITTIKTKKPELFNSEVDKTLMDMSKHIIKGLRDTTAIKKEMLEKINKEENKNDDIVCEVKNSEVITENNEITTKGENNGK